MTDTAAGGPEAVRGARDAVDVTLVWTDPVARALLNPDELAGLPEHPAGPVILDQPIDR